jgi:hypothetical protein
VLQCKEGCVKHPSFFYLYIFIHYTKHFFMAKFRQRIQDNNDAIKQRLRVVLDMMSGTRPANNLEAIRLLTEVRNLVDTNNDLLDLG